MGCLRHYRFHHPERAFETFAFIFDVGVTRRRVCHGTGSACHTLLRSTMTLKTQRTTRFSPVSLKSDDSEEEKINNDKEKHIDYPDKVFNVWFLTPGMTALRFQERPRQDALVRSKILVNKPGPSSKQDE